MLKPLFNRVIIKPAVEEKKTESGIVLPDSARESSLLRGEVVATGPGKTSEKGEVIPVAVKAGDKVLFKKGYGADEIEIDGAKYVLISDDDILGILE